MAEGEFRDRGTRLVVLGAVDLLAGLAFAALGALTVLLAFLPGTLPTGDGNPVGLRSVAAGVILYFLAGLVLVLAGIGSIRARRWVRPVMLVVAWTWLLTGVLSLVFVVFAIDGILLMMAAGGEPLPDEVLPVVRGILLAGITLGGVAVPAFLVWGYTGRDVQRTCEARNPAPCWSDRCPVTVLAWSLGLGLAALLGPLAILLSPNPPGGALPFFGALIVGAPAALLVLATSGACAWLAWATYRLLPAGWWGSLAFVLVLGLSAALTFARVDLATFYIAWGSAPADIAYMEGTALFGTTSMVVQTVVFTALGVIYLVAVRKHFRG